METEETRGLHPAWGFIAVGLYATHAVTLLRAGAAPHLLWSCHLSCLLLAAGIWLRRPVLAGTALLWLTPGLPTWVVSALSVEGFFHATSALTHVLGFGLAVAAVRAGGMPRGTWWRAFLGLVALWCVTRFALSEAHNVNVTRRFWFGWEGEYVSFPVYVGILALLAAGVFFAMEKVVRAVRPARGSGSPCC